MIHAVLLKRNAARQAARAGNRMIERQNPSRTGAMARTEP